LLTETEPTASDPSAGSVRVAAEVVQTTPVTVVPAVTAVVPVTAPVCATPATWIEQAVNAAFDVPELVAESVQIIFDAPAPPPLLVQEVTCMLTCAELVNDPNRPKTNPAMAMAAMRVMAISITVAKTGLIAFLFFLMFMGWSTASYADQTPENGTDAPLLIEKEPIAWAPIAAVPATARVQVTPAVVAPALIAPPPVTVPVTATPEF